MGEQLYDSPGAYKGIRGFAARHFPRLPLRSTWFVNLDTIGSGRLVLLEGEGPVRMHDYDPGFKDLVAGRVRVPDRDHRLGGPPQADPHYHLDSDLPEHVDYGCVASAVRLVEALARELVRR
jgi:hypothetical protein